MEEVSENFKINTFFLVLSSRLLPYCGLCLPLDFCVFNTITYWLTYELVVMNRQSYHVRCVPFKGQLPC
jgi:hypothetical protein